MKELKINDLNEATVNAEEAAEVKGGPAYIKLGDIKGESRRVATEDITLGYTEVEWT